MHYDLMFDSEVVVPMHLCLANVAVVVFVPVHLCLANVVVVVVVVVSVERQLSCVSAQEHCSRLYICESI